MNDGLIQQGLLTNLHGGGGSEECTERNGSSQRSSHHIQKVRPQQAHIVASRLQHDQQRPVYPVSNASGKEVMVLQKLQGALSAVRRERDQEFRHRNMALEKLRSAKEATSLTRNAVQEETVKLNKTTSASQQTIQEIQKMEGSIVNLKRKVRLLQT
jgi:hypothetical protein